MTLNSIIDELRQLADQDGLPTGDQALALADEPDTAALAEIAARIRDRGFHNVVTYSRKVFIPLTHLCRDVCHYCTFAQVPRKLKAPFMTVEEVLADREVAFPLTRAMCAPVGDGAAAVVLCSERFLRRRSSRRAVAIRASILRSGKREGGHDTGSRAAKAAYEVAGVGPEEVDVAEVHDATAYGEIATTEELGFCPVGEGGAFAESGVTAIDGKLPINTGGGLIARGHPVGATGLAQVLELTTQLRGESGKRQVENPRIALAENGGGLLGSGPAAMCIHVLEAPSR